MLLGFHLLDFATNAGDFLFDLEVVLHFAGAGAKNVLKALLGFAGVLEASDEVGMLLRNFFAAVGFVFNTTE